MIVGGREGERGGGEEKKSPRDPPLFMSVVSLFIISCLTPIPRPPPFPPRASKEGGRGKNNTNDAPNLLS